MGKPMAFVPLVLASTRTTSSTVTITSTTITSTTTMTVIVTQTPCSGGMIHKDYRTTAQRSTAVLQVASLPWVLVVSLGLVSSVDSFLFLGVSRIRSYSCQWRDA